MQEHQMAVLIELTKVLSLMNMELGCMVEMAGVMGKKSDLGSRILRTK